MLMELFHTPQTSAHHRTGELSTAFGLCFCTWIIMETILLMKLQQYSTCAGFIFPIAFMQIQKGFWSWTLLDFSPCPGHVLQGTLIMSCIVCYIHIFKESYIGPPRFCYESTHASTELWLILQLAKSKQ